MDIFEETIIGLKHKRRRRKQSKINQNKLLRSQLNKDPKD